MLYAWTRTGALTDMICSLIESHGPMTVHDLRTRLLERGVFKTSHQVRLAARSLRARDILCMDDQRRWTLKALSPAAV